MVCHRAAPAAQRRAAPPAPASTPRCGQIQPAPKRAGGCARRLLIFPKGNGCDFLSVYLDVADTELLPAGWSRRASFVLTVVSSKDPTLSVKKGASRAAPHSPRSARPSPRTPPRGSPAP